MIFGLLETIISLLLMSLAILRVIFKCSSAWQARFDWPIYLAASNRAGHGKQQRKRLITR